MATGSLFVHLAPEDGVRTCAPVEEHETVEVIQLVLKSSGFERVDGEPASDLSLAELRTWLRGDPGTEVVLRLKRAGTERDATIVLRELL